VKTRLRSEVRARGSGVGGQRNEEKPRMDTEKHG
jgi:hypothetical protein